MNSFPFFSFIFIFFAARIAGFVIIDGDLQQAFNEMSEGVGNFQYGVKSLYQKSLEAKKDSRNGASVLMGEDDEEELGGTGIDPGIVFAINKTAGATSKVFQEVLNRIVINTGMNKLGIPVISEDSELMDAMKSQMATFLMGTSVAAAAAANIMNM
ncbi:uncharacterized protein LOC129971076 [Argiope bruennichi]|uniref:uncharacterized protein LOC129971076 n=1 Tax=Argiope bruennichi TaxID=94029 RepID=UPI0024958926|nr:uncharacterized protein LOC129971076 [Argiope bruennichi]